MLCGENSAKQKGPGNARTFMPTGKRPTHYQMYGTTQKKSIHSQVIYLSPLRPHHLIPRIFQRELNRKLTGRATSWWDDDSHPRCDPLPCLSRACCPPACDVPACNVRAAWSGRTHITTAPVAITNIAAGHAAADQPCRIRDE